MVKWEYCDSFDESQEAMAALGLKGWELVSVTVQQWLQTEDHYGGTKYRLFWKRAIKD